MNAERSEVDARFTVLYDEAGQCIRSARDLFVVLLFLSFFFFIV